MALSTEQARELAHSPQRERLLSAAARVSRLLLEATDLMATMPQVLRELGEAAEVDRTALAIVETDTDGKRWLVVKSEWSAECRQGEHSQSVRIAWEDRASHCCAQLRTGRSVYVGDTDQGSWRERSIAVGAAKSSIIVPFLIDGEYVGAIGFDDCRKVREFEPAVVSALEIAAGVIGAALHRERLLEVVRREREHAAEQRVAELAKANAALRLNLEWLAGAAEPKRFFDHALLQAVRQFDAAAGVVVMLSETDEQWRVIAHVRAGQVEDPPYATTVPSSSRAFAELADFGREPRHWPLERVADSDWPGVYEYHRAEGHQSVYALPLVFGDRNVGFLVLSFAHREPLGSAAAELLVAIGQQMTFAMVYKRLTKTAKDAAVLSAVLSERNRIGQEIHDGLAQSFVGILMQLGAAEAQAEDSPLSAVLTTIRDLAREGLSEARRSVLALRPGERRAGGLEFALRQLAERSTVVGRVQCTFAGGGVPTRLAPEHEHELLRIAQEAVSNALRHGQPRNVAIHLAVEAEELRLEVADDGCGMQELPDSIAQQGFGLTNMRERAQAIGGEWQVESRPGSGTRIRVRVAGVR